MPTKLPQKQNDFKMSDKLSKNNEQQLPLANVSKPFICGVDYGDGQSQGAFAVFKNGKLHWHTIKAWKVKIYLWWCKVRGIKILKEAN